MRNRLLFFFLCCLCHCVFGQHVKKIHDIHKDSVAVVQTLDRFVNDFTNLRWENFISHFSDDVTAFFPPSAKFSYRANNKSEVADIFRKVFEHAKKQKSGPPYLVIDPKEMLIQVSGTIAVASFLLEDPDLLGRRTIVLRNDGNDTWKIIHLHASGAPLVVK